MLKSIVAALGRMCLSIFFILSAIGKISDWTGTQQYILNGISTWLQQPLMNEHLIKLLQELINWPFAIAIIATIFELFGGLMVFLGLNVRFGAVLLLLALIPATLLFHSFWLLEGPDRTQQFTMFIKNISILGGLLVVLAYGKGSSKAPKKEAPSK